jgi:hypothetical protein
MNHLNRMRLRALRRSVPAGGAADNGYDPRWPLLTYRQHLTRLINGVGLSAQHPRTSEGAKQQCQQQRHKVSGQPVIPCAVRHQKGRCPLSREKAMPPVRLLRTCPHRHGGKVGYPAPEESPATAPGRPTDAHTKSRQRWPNCARVLMLLSKAVPERRIGTAQSANILTANSFSQRQNQGARPHERKGGRSTLLSATTTLTREVRE